MILFLMVAKVWCIKVCMVFLDSQLPNMPFCHTRRICNFIDSLISWVHLFTESYLSDIDNIVPFENTTPINQN